VMNVSHSRLSSMGASVMHSRIGKADAAVTVGGAGLGSEVIQEFTAGSANVGDYTLVLVVITLRTYYLQNRRQRQNSA
jgi:hypothetical protein